MIGAIVQFFKGWSQGRQMERDRQLEGLLHAKHLQPGHYYLFVYDMRSISKSMCMDLSRMLHKKGIDSGFLRVRGTPPMIYDLKRPEEEI